MTNKQMQMGEHQAADPFTIVCGNWLIHWVAVLGLINYATIL